MTREEILKAADDTVEMFHFEGRETTLDDKVHLHAMVKNNVFSAMPSVRSAILHYEKIVELAESVDLYFKVDDFKAILVELKSRL